MIEFLQVPEERKRAFIAQTTTETGMTEKAVEKDWWVTLVLRAIFTLPMAEHFVFSRKSHDLGTATSPLMRPRSIARFL